MQSQTTPAARAIAKARRIESGLRDMAFLPVLEEIAGVPVKQLTLRHLLILLAVRSPFLFGAFRGPEDVALFLWVVSPQYNRRNLGRGDFLQSIAALPYATTTRAIERYIDRSLMDRPPTVSSARPVIGASFVASLVTRIAEAFGWDDEVILDKPIARLYQYLGVLRAESNPKAPQFHPFSDRIRGRMLARRNNQSG